MAEGVRNWVAGDTLTAADINDYCVEQSIMRFADHAARVAGIGSVDGWWAFLHDTNCLEVGAGGSTWSTVGPVHGALTSWTPAVTQSGSVTVTNTYSRYQRIGRRVKGWFDLAVTGSGTLGNAVTISLPVTAAVANDTMVGRLRIFDSSAAASYKGDLVLSTTSLLAAISDGNGTNALLGVGSFTAGLASPDTLKGFIDYEAAADA
jgi:hypothetical protein